jgi:ferredoxin
MKVRVDRARCEGYGTCAALLPEVFQLDDWGTAAVVNDGQVPEGKEEPARRAVFECPMAAITFED